ncbi:MAG: hypothetical protein EB078_01475 [Proteobacteria bacterium]|nr:hypothetical protein [Pseudomonadota bacterium]
MGNRLHIHAADRHDEQRGRGAGGHGTVGRCVWRVVGDGHGLHVAHRDQLSARRRQGGQRPVDRRIERAVGDLLVHAAGRHDLYPRRRDRRHRPGGRQRHDLGGCNAGGRQDGLDHADGQRCLWPLDGRHDGLGCGPHGHAVRVSPADERRDGRHIYVGHGRYLRPRHGRQHGITVANIDTANPVTVTVAMYANATNSGTAYEFASGVAIEAGRSLVVVDKTLGASLLENQSIYVTAGTSSKLKVNAFWKELS